MLETETLDKFEVLETRDLSTIVGGGRSDYNTGVAYGKMIGYFVKGLWTLRYL